jgi:hypothetical protein
MAAYIYDVLPKKTRDTHYIRILDLLPAVHRHNRLECFIREGEIGSGTTDEPYEALSYVWGEDTVCDLVLCGTARIPIGKNLSVALRRLRRADLSRALWVDAISINQRDVAEKEVQVGSMYQVYCNAQQVIIFVGEAATPLRHWDARAAFDLATKFARVEKIQPTLDMRSLSIPLYRASTKRLEFPGLGHRSYTALRLFFTLPWFNRMWVVQEAACATQATIVSGEHEMSWHDFIRGIDFGLRSGLFAPAHTRRTFPFTIDAAPRGNLSTAIQMYRLGQSQTCGVFSISSKSTGLSELLRRFHGSHAKDPRDKVFALIGLASLPVMATLRADLDMFEVHVNYCIKTHVLFQRLAQSILESSGCLDLLSVPSRRANGPIWVPDWAAVDQQTQTLSYTAFPTYQCSKIALRTPLLKAMSSSYMVF